MADTIKSQLRLAFQQVTTFPTLILKAHATVYPTGLVFAIKKKNHRGPCQQELLPREAVIGTSS